MPRSVPGMNPVNKGTNGNNSNRTAKKEFFQQRSQPTSTPELNGPKPTEYTAVMNPNAEKEKKIKTVNKKIRQIKDLKERRAAGEVLELTQLKKIDTEFELLKELKELSLA